MIRKLRWKNLRLPLKLLLIYVPLIILPGTLGIFLLTDSFTDMGKRLTETYTSDLLSLMLQKVEDRLSGYEQFSKQIMTDDRLHELLKQEPATTYQKFYIESAINEQLNVLWLGDEQNKFIRSIKIQTDRNTYVYGTDAIDGYRIGEGEYIEQIRAQNGGSVWFAPENFTDGYDEIHAFRLGRVIRDRKLQEIGILTLVIDTEAIQQVFEQTEFKDSVKLQLLDASRHVLVSNDLEMDAEEHQLLDISERSIQNGWLLSTQLPLDPLFSPIENTTRWAVILIIACAGLGLILTHLISVDVIIPIRKMMLNMKKGIKGVEPKQLQTIKGAVEIVEMNDTFISVMYEIQQLIQQVVKKESLKREAEIQVLQQQLSPHFLYNTLNTIRWMAMIQKQDNIKEMVESLSKLLSYSLRSPNSLVTLNEEIDVLHDYVKIQKVRYDEFYFHVEVDEGLAHAEILKFLLQPVIENALIHGLAGSDDIGDIYLQVLKHQQSLRIEIRDNGVGMDRAKLEQVRTGLCRTMTDGKHIGLRNIHDRIQYHYGSEFGIRIDSKPQEGTKVTIDVPLQLRGERK